MSRSRSSARIVDASGKLTARRLFSKDFTRAGMDFATSYESKWLQAKTSTDPVKGPKLLQKYLNELRGKRRILVRRITPSS